MPEHEFTVPDDPIPEVQPVVDPVVDPIYERQATLPLHKPSVMLVGAGGVGCWTALALVLGGVEDITIFDGDTVSLNNLNRLPLPEAMVGELKSVALARWLETLRPKARITARGMFDPSVHTSIFTNGDTAIQWLVCCTDSLKSRKECYAFATKYEMKYLELGADGERWTLSPAPPEFSTELEAEAGYSSVPVHVGPCMMAGAAAAYYVLHDCVPIVSHSTNWLKGPIIRSRPNLGALKFESMSEVIIRDRLFTCPDCGVEIELHLITIMKHHRKHNPGMGLVEAKVWAEAQVVLVEASIQGEADEMAYEPSEAAIEFDDEEPLVVAETENVVTEEEHGEEV